MGMVYADISVTNGEDLALSRRGHLAAEQVRRMTVSALVDKRAYMLGINEEIQAQLGVSTICRAPARLADGTVVESKITLADRVRPDDVIHIREGRF